MTIQQISEIGGIFALLTFWHFVADWLPQSHAEAMAKSSDSHVRALHCAVYTVLMIIPVCFLIQMQHGQSYHSAILYCIFMAILFVSHFYEDTYKPVVWWLKQVRRIPQFENAISDHAAIMNFLEHSNGLGYILLITVDQLVHIAFVLIISVLLIIF